MVTLRFGMRRYVVGSFLTKGSPIESSTPGGIEMGVRPSFEGLAAVEEKGRRHDGVVVAGEDDDVDVAD